MSNPNKQVVNYETGMNLERIRQKLETKLPAMKARFAERMMEEYDIEQKVKEILASEKGVSIITNFFYQAFAREIYGSRFVTKGGEELNAEVAVFIEKWSGRGLKESVLVRIRDEVFSIPAP